MSDFVYLPAADWDYRLDVEPALALLNRSTPGDLYRCPHGHTITIPNLASVTCEKAPELCRPMLVASVRASVPLPVTTQTGGNAHA